MADNENVNRFVNQVDVEKAPGLETKLKGIQKLFKRNLDETYEPRIITKLDSKSYKQVNKSFKQLSNNWNRIQKKSTGGMFSFGKDKREIGDINNLFGKLKIRLAESMEQYQKQLDALTGPNGDNGAGSEYDAINNKIELYGKRLERVKDIQREWQSLRDRLTQEKTKYDGLPSVAQVQAKKNKLQKEYEQLDKKINDNVGKSFKDEGNKNNIETKIKDAVNRYNIAIKQATALKEKFNDDENYKLMVGQLRQMQVEIRETERAKSELVGELSEQESALQAKYDEALSKLRKRYSQNGAKNLSDISKQLMDVKNQLADADNELDRLGIKKKLFEGYKKAYKNARTDGGSDYKGKNWKYNNLKNDNTWQVGQAGQKETNAINWAQENTKADKYLENLKTKREMIKNEIQNINKEMKQAGKSDDKKQKLDLQIEGVDLKIKQAEDLQDKINDKTDLWKSKLEGVKQEVEYIKEQMQLLQQDAMQNPWKVNLKSDAMKPLNQQLDEAQRKWGVMGNLVDKLKAKLAGVKGYMKQMTPLSKLWHKVILNIYSQIATLVNPLNIFKNAWSSWINRWDNLPWKNTFEVIGYNLTSVIAPLMEKIATLALKFVAALNVLTKKWFNVDLFDKSAWSMEQIKKGVGQLTASFDELHSSTDNPNQLNTVFDTGLVDADSLISDDMKAKLEKFAEWAEGAFGKVKAAWKTMWNWIKEHPILAAIGAITLAALLSKLGLGGVLTALGSWLFKGLKGAVKLGWEGIKWLGPKVLSGVKWLGTTLWNGTKTAFSKIVEYAPKVWHSIKIGALKVASKIETIWNKSTYAIGNFLNKGLYTGMNGANVTMGKLLGGIGLVAGGTALAATTASKAGKNWQDYNKWQKAGAVGMVGIGSAAAGLGAVMLGASGPVGWAVAGAVALGSFAIGMSKVQDGIGSVKDEQEKWETAQQNLATATQNVETATNNYTNELSNLEELERQTGLSGESLYKSVESGKLSVDKMTSAQLQVYNAYVKTKEASNQLKQAQADKVKYEKEEAEGMIRTALAARKKKDDYTDAKDAILKAVEEEKISTEEAADYFSRLMGNMTQDARDALMQEIPADIAACVEPTKYASGWEKFGIGWNKFWSGVWEGTKGILGEIGKGIKGAWDGISGAVGKVWDGMKTTAGNIWNSIKIEAGEAWDGIKNSAIGQKVQEIASNVSTKWNELKTKAGEAWENIKTKAGEKWQQIKDSAIGQKVQDIYSKTKSKFNEIKTELSNGWNTLKTNASTAWTNIKNSIVNGAKSAWEGAKGFFSKIGEGVKSAWEGIKGFVSNTGEKIGNFFSGNGLKTNSEVEEYKKKNNINSYAVGTNYVPNDQLAYIHKGEAIIPEKYNKPYKDTSNSNATNAVLNELRMEINRLHETVSQGIKVTGEFRQRGQDLVAAVEKVSNKNSNKVLNNKVYAR